MPNRTTLVLGALLTSVAVGTAQQGTPGPSTSAPNLVRTELFATLEGKPVTDLALDEVQVLEDGTPQTIDRLDLVQPRVGEERLSVVVFVDTYHSSIEGSRPLRAALARALEEGLSPRDRVALTSAELIASELTFGTLADAVGTVWPSDFGRTLNKERGVGRGTVHVDVDLRAEAAVGCRRGRHVDDARSDAQDGGQFLAMGSRRRAN